MPLRAVFFDVGGTLIESAEQDPWRPIVLQRIEQEFGHRPWAEALYAADIRRPPAADPHRQETNRWLADWLRENGEVLSDADVERLRIAFAAPLPEAYSLAAGAAEALRWCKGWGLKVVLITNTISRADADVRGDFERRGLGEEIDHVVSSYSTGWMKPHPAIFTRALELAGATPAEGCTVGDDFDLDVVGSKELGMRAVWKSARDLPEGRSARPDAVIASLEELPRVLRPWLRAARRASHRS